MRKRTSKHSKDSFSAETSLICRMCLSKNGALEPINSDKRGAYLLQKIFTYTNVEMKLLPKFPSYLCSACKSRLDSLDKFRCLCVLKNEKVKRFHEEVDTTRLTAAETTAEHPDDIHRTDGVESVSVKTEVAAEHSETDCQSNRMVSNSQPISGTYNYYRDDLFEAEEESLEALLKREPKDEPQQLSDADLKHEHIILKTEPSDFNCKFEGEASMAEKPITSHDDSVSVSYQNNYCIRHDAEGPTLNQMDPIAAEDSRYPCYPSDSTVNEQQLLPSNEHQSPQQDITVAESPESPKHYSKINTDFHRIEQKLQCPHCSATYSQTSKLKIHLRTHTGKKPFQCKVCDKAFHGKVTLNHHMKIHNKDQQHQCRQCPQKFTRSTELKNHIRTHTGEKPYQCEVCGRSFPAARYLSIHSKIHNKDRQHQCPQCPKRFAQRTQLKNHIIKHTGEKAFQCEVCDKAFHTNAILKIHTKMHNKDQQHQCPQCPKRFVQITQLKHHIIAHTGEKPFQCKVCDKAFHTKINLNQHAEIHNKDQQHQCPQCPQRFPRTRELINHIRRHTGEKPFLCEVCGRAFLWKKSLTKHTEIHNKDQQGQEPATALTNSHAVTT